MSLVNHDGPPLVNVEGNPDCRQAVGVFYFIEGASDERNDHHLQLRVNELGYQPVIPGLLRNAAGALFDRFARQKASPPSQGMRRSSTLRSNSNYGITDSQGDVFEMLKAFRSVVFSCIHARAKEVANKAAFRAYRVTSPGEFEEMPGTHPLNLLMAKPNPYLTPFEVWYNTIAAMDLTGNSYAWIGAARAPRDPKELWLLSPEIVKIIPGDITAGEPPRKGYSIQTQNMGAPKAIPAEEVLHLRHPNPNDLYLYGGSLVMRAAYEVDIHQYILNYQREFFANYAMPSWMLVFPNEMSDPVREKFNQQWEEKYSGKPGKVFTAEGDKDIRLEKLTADSEMGYLESHGVNLKTLLGVFGVPPSKLMLTESIEARATAEVSNFTFHSETIDPLLTMVAQQMTLDLAFPFYGPDIVIRHDPTIPKDPKVQADLDGLKLEQGVTTINEIRLRDGQPRIEGGDEPLVSFTKAPLSQVVAAGEMRTDPNQEQDPNAGDQQDDDQEDQGKAALLVAMKRPGDMNEFQRKAAWRDHDRFRTRFEVRIGSVLRTQFNAIRDEVLRKIEAAGPEGASPKAAGDGLVLPIQIDPLMFNVDEWIEKLRPVLAKQTLEVLRASFDRFVREHKIRGVVFSPAAPAVDAALRKLNDKTQTIPETLHAELHRTLVEGIERKETLGSLARRVSRFFQSTSDWRALRIARTVSNFGVNTGNAIAAGDAGLTKKTWLTMRDDRVRDDHAAVDGDQVGIHDDFQMPNGDRMAVPGDPRGSAENVINCRCTAIYTF